MRLSDAAREWVMAVPGVREHTLSFFESALGRLVAERDTQAQARRVARRLGPEHYVRQSGVPPFRWQVRVRPDA